MKHIWTDNLPKRPGQNTRSSDRRTVELPARLTWKDQRGTTRFATVVTRNVSAFGVYIESQTPLSIPMFRLVQLQLERDTTQNPDLPESLQHGGRVLSAVYRVSPPSSTARQGFALRLMVDPHRLPTPAVLNQATA